MATPETPNNTSVGLKEQLQVALAGAIGITAGAIVWEAIFRDDSLAWSFAGWIALLFLAGGSITLAWARGVFRRPEQAAKFGALTGMIVGGAVDLVFFWIFADLPRPPFSQQIDTTILAMFRWGLYGFLGGLAIEKGWGRRSAFRVALGVGVAGVIASFIQVFYEDSIHGPQVFSDPDFWVPELSRQFLRAFGWALGIFLLLKSDDVLRRQHEDKDAFSRKEIETMPSAAEAGLKDQLETALAATIGVGAGLVVWYAIFESGALAWNLATLGFLLSVGFSVWLSIRYLDPFFERVRGDGEPGSRSRLRSVSLLGVSATFPVAIFTQLNDKLLTDEPQGMILWLVAALGAGSITLAWARGLRRLPARAAELGALTGVLVVGGSYLGVRTFAILLNLRSVEESIAIVIDVVLLWGLYGLVGGLAIERGRGIRLPLRVGLGVGVAGLIAVGGLLFASVGGPNSENLRDWLKVLSKVFFVAVGWAWGITLWPRSDDVLRARRVRS